MTHFTFTWRLLKDPIADKTFRNIYIPTHTRATPYLVGMFTGYIKYKIKHSDFKFTSRIVYSMWTISVLLLLTTVYSAYFFYVPGDYDVHASAIYASFHHLTWSICISWFILGLSTGNGCKYTEGRRNLEEFSLWICCSVDRTSTFMEGLNTTQQDNVLCFFVPWWNPAL